MTSESNGRSATTSICDFIETKMEQEWSMSEYYCNGCPLENQCHWTEKDGMEACALMIKIRAALDLEYPGELGMLVRFLRSAGIKYHIITEGLDKDDGEKWYLVMYTDNKNCVGYPGYLFSKWGNWMHSSVTLSNGTTFRRCRSLYAAPEGGWNKK